MNAPIDHRESVTSLQCRRGAFRPPSVFVFRGGFTLVELMMVLVIVALLAGIAAPRWERGASRYQVESAAARIVADIQQTRRAAMASSSSQTITFDSATETYTITMLKDLDRRGSGYVVNLAAEPYKVDLDYAIDAAGNPVLRFDGWGEPSSAFRLRIVCGGESRTINFSNASHQCTVTSP